MEAAEDRTSRDGVILVQGVSMVRSWREQGISRFRKSRSQACMGSALVVVSDPLRQDRAQLFFVQWNHEIEALAAYRSHQPFAVGIRLGRSRRRAQHP